MGNVHVVGPSEVLIISGGCRYPRKKIIAGGGCIWTWYVGNKVQTMSLALMTLTPTCENAETFEGVPITVSGIAHCKISKEDALLELAAEQFLDRSTKQIADAIQLTLEGHLRAILGSLTVEEVYKSREKFANAVWEIAAADLAKMGIEIVSFTIRDIYDRVNYLSSLGKAQTAQVVRDANIGVAEAERDAGIKESECERIAMASKCDSFIKIADHFTMYQLKKSAYEAEVNAAKAEADLAYELQASKIQQRIKKEELQIEVIGKQKEGEIEKQEIRRKELELNTDVKLTTASEMYSRKMMGQGRNYEVKQTALGEYEKVTKVGLAEAYKLEVVGVAKAEKNKLRALALQKYEHAAITNLFLESLPKIAAAVCAPLSKTGDIVLVSNKDQLKRMLNRQIGHDPP